MYKVTAAMVFANLLRNNPKRQFVTVKELLEIKRVIEYVYVESSEDVLVEVSSISVGSALFNYPALFVRLKDKIYRAEQSKIYYEGTYIDDWFNQDAPFHILQVLKELS